MKSPKTLNPGRVFLSMKIRPATPGVEELHCGLLGTSSKYQPPIQDLSPGELGALRLLGLLIGLD